MEVLGLVMIASAVLGLCWFQITEHCQTALSERDLETCRGCHKKIIPGKPGQRYEGYCNPDLCINGAPYVYPT